MARLSKEEHDNILKSISESANGGAEMMDFVDKLRKDFDESLQVDDSEVRKEWESKYNQAITERDKASGERDESRRQYRERFFSSGTSTPPPEQEIEKPKKPKTIDEIFGFKK